MSATNGANRDAIADVQHASPYHIGKRTSELLRIATAGSVDDGKSTLIGRLLHDTKSIFEDQMEHVVQTSERRGDGYVNLALLTDGLRAERERPGRIQARGVDTDVPAGNERHLRGVQRAVYPDVAHLRDGDGAGKTQIAREIERLISAGDSADIERIHQ